MIGGISAAATALSQPLSANRNGAGNSQPESTETSSSEISANNSVQNPQQISSQNLNVLLAAQEGQTNAEGLTEEEQEVVNELKQIDQEVRAHEQAHKSAAGPYAGPISYETTTGPDGREYAIGGSVQIDVSPIPGNPEATIRKAEIVERAALAPAQPSPEDFSVARAAQALRQQAQNELSEQREAERNGDEEEGSGGILAAIASEGEEDSSTSLLSEAGADAANNPLAFFNPESIFESVNIVT